MTYKSRVVKRWFRRIFFGLAVIACLSLCATAEAYYWDVDDVDHSSGVWENLWGYFTDYSVAIDDELAAFTLGGDVFVGWYLIDTAGEYGWVDVWATNGTVVYFLVWDVSESEEISLGSNYTISDAQVFPGGGPTQHNLGTVPEPPGIILLIVSLGFIGYFFFRPRFSFVRNT